MLYFLPKLGLKTENKIVIIKFNTKKKNRKGLHFFAKKVNMDINPICHKPPITINTTTNFQITNIPEYTSNQFTKTILKILKIPILSNFQLILGSNFEIRQISDCKLNLEIRKRIFAYLGLSG